MYIQLREVSCLVYSYKTEREWFYLKYFITSVWACLSWFSCNSFFCLLFYFFIPQRKIRIWQWNLKLILTWQKRRNHIEKLEYLHLGICITQYYSNKDNFYIIFLCTSLTLFYFFIKQYHNFANFRLTLNKDSHNLRCRF